MKPLLALLAVAAYGQTYSAVTADKISPSGARITWTTSTSVASNVRWGTAPATYTNTNPSINGFGVTAHQWYISGAPPATTIYYNVCATLAPVSCDAAEYSFTTSAQPSVWPAIPTAPAALSLPALPGSYTSTDTVSADCSDFETKLATLAAGDGNNNYKLIIPSGAYCSFLLPGQIVGDANYESLRIPVKTGANPSGTGTIVIQSAATLPPEGARITSAWTTSYFVNTNIGIVEKTAAQQNVDYPSCLQGQMYIDVTVASGGGWPLKECTTNGTTTYNSVSKTDFSGALLSSCTSNSWYYKTDATNPSVGIYRCDNLGRFLHVQGGNTANIKVNTSAKGYRFVGITFDALRWGTSSPPAWLTSNDIVQGSRFSSLVNMQGADSITFDRCRFLGGSYPNRYQQLVTSYGTNITFANSSFEGISQSLTPVGGCAEPSNQAEYAGLNLQGGSNYLITNNYFEGVGLMIIGSDDLPQYASDVRITGNYFYRPNTFFLGATGSDGRFYQNRHAVELKRGVRWLIQGNTVEKGFSTINNAFAFALSMRPGADGATVVMTDVDVRDNLIYTNTNGIYTSGHNDNDGAQAAVVKNIRIANNILYDIDGSLQPTGCTAFVRRGDCIEVALGADSVIVEGNTCVYPGVGEYPGAYVLDINGGMSGATAFTNNLMTHVTPVNSTSGVTRPNNSNRGTASLAAFWQQYSATPNIFINLNSQDPATYPSGNLWPADTAAVGFFDSTTHNYRLKYSSTYAPTGIGANPDVVRASSLETYNQRAVSTTTTTASLAWTAPDATTACTVETGTSATPGTGTRVTDTPTSRFRTKSITGLTTGTLYYYRVYCSQMVSGTFTTK